MEDDSSASSNILWFILPLEVSSICGMFLSHITLGVEGSVISSQIVNFFCKFLLN